MKGKIVAVALVLIIIMCPIALATNPFKTFMNYLNIQIDLLKKKTQQDNEFIDKLNDNVRDHIQTMSSIKPSQSDYTISSRDNKVSISFERDVKLARKNDYELEVYCDSHSMNPTISCEHTTIQYPPKSENEIQKGDIIWYKQANRLIIHRVLEKGRDSEGVYFRTKGDANNGFIANSRDYKDYLDPKIVRFKDIKYKVVGVIW